MSCNQLGFHPCCRQGGGSWDSWVLVLLNECPLLLSRWTRDTAFVWLPVARKGSDRHGMTVTSCLFPSHQACFQCLGKDLNPMALAGTVCGQKLCHDHTNKAPFSPTPTVFKSLFSSVFFPLLKMKLNELWETSTVSNTVYSFWPPWPFPVLLL